MNTSLTKTRSDSWAEPRIKTRSEQMLEWLFQMSKHRKLTNEEWEQVRRCEHAIYCRARKQEIQKADEELMA